MQGKATLILTDKDTGRVVEQIEEHNMVTNALNRIFTLPPTLVYGNDSRDFFKGFLPMYQNLLKGIILFGENVPESADNIKLSNKYNILATAGDGYSGADAMRGSFNENQSCEIENGYRFVWDFAPEKAIGTIKCLSLTHRTMGNRGNLLLPGDQSYFLVTPTDLTVTNYSSNYATLFNATGITFLQQGKNTFYSYYISSNAINILKHRINDPSALKICDNLSPVLESQTPVGVNLTIGSSYTSVFYDPTAARLYAVERASIFVNNIRHYRFRYATVNPFTCVKEYESGWITTGALFETNPYEAVIFGGKFYSYAFGSISVCSLSGVLEKRIDLGITQFFHFLVFEGKIAIECRLTANGRRCIYVLEEPKNLIHQPDMLYRIIDSNEIHYPYCYAHYANSVYVMFRTDYLATINNLSAPLEKTDRHALQIRYEITN